MKQNKWLKWIVGLGGISTFTLFLQTIDANNNQTDNRAQNYVQNENMSVVNNEQTLSTNKDEREQQLVALDWEEGNWDVELTNDVIIATPKSSQPYMSPAQDRTRRS